MVDKLSYIYGGVRVGIKTLCLPTLPLDDLLGLEHFTLRLALND